MGFTIMESFMDNVEVESVLGLGTKIIMSKKIKTNSSQEITQEMDISEDNSKELINSGVRGEE